jgi:hypothetical protein
MRAKAKANDVLFHPFSDRLGPGVPLSAWLESRKGHRITAGWKEETIERGVFYGPLQVMDETELKADPEADEMSIPFFAPYAGDSTWITKAQAETVAKHLGIEFRG